MKVNDEEIIPKKILMNGSEWILQAECKGKTKLIPLKDIDIVDNLPIDEVLIIRPLTNKLVVDPLTNIVLKIYVDTKDIITGFFTEVREENAK